MVFVRTTKLIRVVEACALVCMLFLVFSAGIASGETDSFSDSGWVQIFFGKSNDSAAGYSVQQTSD
ncbi:MAG: hypothetical protein GKC08_03080, partial [Methanosarcinales archaeon]|nr:hypothetical protein [Methanosarcinales archaeon]